MVDWKKKIMKHVGGDLDATEQLEAATFMQAAGATKKMALGGAVGGAIGAVIASQTGKKKNAAAEGSIAAGFPKPPFIMGLTSRRLLVWSQGSVSGRPKELLGTIPVSSLSGFTVGDGRMTRPVSLDFVDGSSVPGEVPKAAKPDEFAEAVARFVR